MFDIIAAVHISNNAIGKNGKLPWKNAADMRYFQALTTETMDADKKNAVIMGRKTYESIGKPLRNRENIVLTSAPDQSNPMFQSNFDVALQILGANPKIEKIFVIGGESIYKTALDHDQCRKVYLNLISTDCDVKDADTFFPKIDMTKFNMIREFTIAPDVLNRVYLRNPENK
jgi:dihydrofolate reductase